MKGYSKGDMLVMVGMTAMVEEEGMTPHEAMGRVDQIQKDIYFALVDIKKETEAKK